MHRLKTRAGTYAEIINTGNFLLDGGSMFGRAPKMMWERWFPADEENRILMATNILKIQAKGTSYQVDAGMGSMWDEKERKLFGIEGQDPYRGDADYLIFTHLHFDHCGGISNIDVREKVLVSKKEWADAMNNNNPLTRGSYRKADLDAIEPNLKCIEPPYKIADRIEILPTPGHTKGHISVLIDRELFYPGDLIPTSAHVHLPYIMAYDLFPLEILRAKKRMLEMALEEDWIVIFEHDPYIPFAKIDKKDGKFKTKSIME